MLTREHVVDLLREQSAYLANEFGIRKMGLFGSFAKGHPGEGRWVCAVSKRLDGEGFLTTAYPTDAIKEGELVWPK